MDGGAGNLNVTTNGTVRGGVAGVSVSNLGSGTTTFNNAGTLSAASGPAFEAIGRAAVVNNSGTLNGYVALTANNDVVNNSGRFVAIGDSNFGAGSDVFNNSGTVQIGSGATAPVAVRFTGLETFNNTGGLVDLRNGRTGDTLTLPGTFVGSGDSRLGLDVLLDGTANDRLVITGAATGRTQVLVGTPTGTAVFAPGNLLVQAGAASSADAFDFTGGFIETGLVRNEIIYNPADFSFRLTGALSDSAFQTLAIADGVRNLWLKSADAVSGQLRAQRDTLWSNPGGEPSPRFWFQMHASEEIRRSSRNTDTFGQSRVVDTGSEQTFVGGQLGLDIGGGSGERGGFAFGVTGGYIGSELELAATDLSFDAVNAGVYGSFTSGNLFFNALAKYDYYWADLEINGGSFRQESEGDSYGARGEVGFRFGSDSFFVEPAASISYVKTEFDDFSVLGTQVNFDEEDGLRGRAGARIGGTLDMLASSASFYVGGNYVHEFQGEDGATFTNNGQRLTIVNDRMKDYGEAIAGINVGQSDGMSAFLEGTYIRSFNDDARGDLPLEGFNGRFGVRFRF